MPTYIPSLINFDAGIDLGTDATAIFEGAVIYTTPVTMTDNIWTVWNNAANATQTATTSTTWSYWVTAQTTSRPIGITTWADLPDAPAHRRAEFVPPVLTTEQIMAREARLAEQRRAAEAAYQESIRRRDNANARAERLLLECLNARQREQYTAHGFFVVERPDGIRYRIRKGRMGNVDVVGRDGKVIHRLCAHPYDNVPDCDTMLAQKLMLETDPDSFIRLANKHQAPIGQEAVLPQITLADRLVGFVDAIRH